MRRHLKLPKSPGSLRGYSNRSLSSKSTTTSRRSKAFAVSTKNPPDLKPLLSTSSVTSMSTLGDSVANSFWRFQQNTTQNGTLIKSEDTVPKNIVNILKGDCSFPLLSKLPPDDSKINVIYLSEKQGDQSQCDNNFGAAEQSYIAAFLKLKQLESYLEAQEQKDFLENDINVETLKTIVRLQTRIADICLCVPRVRLCLETYELVLKRISEIDNIDVVEQHKLPVQTSDFLDDIEENEWKSFHKCVLCRIVTIHQHMGQIFLEKDELKKSYEHYKNSVSAYRKIDIEDEDHEKFLRGFDLSVVLDIMGGINMALENNTGALGDYKKLISVLKTKAKKRDTEKKSKKIVDKTPESNFFQNTNNSLFDEQSIASIISAHTQMGNIYENAGDYSSAKSHYAKSMAMRNNMIRELSRGLASDLVHISKANKMENDDISAYTNYSRALDFYKEIEPDNCEEFCQDHVDVLEEMGDIHFKKNELNDAFKFFGQRLDKLHLCPTAEIAEVVETLIKMARILQKSKKYDKAINYYKLALGLQKKMIKLSKHRPEIKQATKKAMSLTSESIADCFVCLGQEKALIYYKASYLDGDRTLFSIQIHNKVGIGLAKNKKYSEAILVFKAGKAEVLDVNIGGDDTLQSDKVIEELISLYSNMGNAYIQLNKFNKALDCYTHSLKKSRERNHSSPDVLFNLGNLLYKMKEHEKAEEYLKEYLIPFVAKGELDLAELEMKETRENRVKVADVMNNMGNLLYVKKQLTESAKYYRDALTIKEGLYGDESKELVGTLGNLGSVMSAQRNYGDATNFFDKAMKIAKKEKCDKQTMATISSRLGNMNVKLKKYEEALESYKHAATLRSQITNGSTEDIIVTQHNIAVVYILLKDYSKGIAVYQEVIRKKRKLVGNDHADVGSLFIDLTNAYLSANDHVNAKKACLSATLILKKSNLPKDHPYILKAVKTLQKVKQSSRR